jgi:catechol 2,3-dioxygenase-like lactoylglutathione lyase family enzyme
VPPPYTFDFVVLWFEVADNQYIHLLHKPQPDTISPRHFALHVTDATAAREHCRGRGLAVEETVRIPNADRFFIRDPDGNRIELIQWSQPYDPAAR